MEVAAQDRTGWKEVVCGLYSTSIGENLATLMSDSLRCLFFNYLRQWNEVNIGGDYEIGRSVCRVCLAEICTFTSDF